MIPESNLPPEESPREQLEANPADWNTRLQSASLLYDQGVLHDASALIWEADRIPCVAVDLALAACILAKDQPGKAIRLLTAVLENNRGKAAQNMGMANALLHHGLVLQSARFYGAALEINPELVNLEFEHFFIWADDEQLLWGDFKGRRQPLHELPWMTRDSMEALELTRDVSRHTTPIAVPKVDQGEGGTSATTEALREKLTENPGDWDTRRRLAELLHDHGAYGEAAVLIWESGPIPSTDLDTAFATRVFAKEEPREAIRLLTTVFERNRGKAGQNMGVANALLHHGMVLESARFYGAALDADPNLVNPNFEHFLLWTDDAKSLWGNFLKIRSPLGLFPWAHSDPTLDFGADFSTPPILLSELKPVEGENLTNHLYQQLARKNARITPPPSVTFPDRGANDQEKITGLDSEEEAKVEAAEKTRADAAKLLAEEQAAAEAKAASLVAEAAESAKTLIERARQEATTEVAAIRAKAQEELQATLEQARQNTEQEMAAIRAKAREEAEAAADAARKEAEFQAALIRAKAEEAAAQAEAAAKLRAEEEERSTATAKQLAVEQANAAAEQAAAAQVAAEKARQEAISEVAAMHAKAQGELKATLEQARQNSEQEMAAIRAKAREEAESEAALIRTKAEEDARAAEKTRLEATAKAEAAAKLLAEENARALALAKQRVEEEERAAAVANRLAEEQARAAAEKIHQEAITEVSAIRAKAEEDAKTAAAAAEQARLEAAAQAKAAAEILARAEEEARALALAKQRTEEEERALAARKRIAEEQAQAAAQQARQEALAELATIKAQAQEELKTAAEQARLNSEMELQMLRAKAREESKAVIENATKEAALISPDSEESAKLESSRSECAPPAAVGPIANEPLNAEEKGRISQPESNTKRRFCVLLVSAAAAMGVWQWIPGTPLDRAAFTAVASGFANGPLFVSGQGTHASPWKVRAFSSNTKPDKRQAPVIVSLGDDLEGFFKSSPPAPIDMAVLFKNFQRLGAKKAATAAVLTWETPDTIELAALEKSLDRFDALAMAAPLSRGAVSSSMPPAFRRASIPVTAVHGDISALPMVNRISIPGVILGGEKTSAGFSVLESETPGKFPPLMARWEDRVVLSFPLLTVLQRFDLPPDGMEVRLGEFLKLGPNGPIVPIDRYGRLELPLKPLSAYAQFPAEALIDGGEDLFPKQAPDPVILRDDRSAAEPATRAFSKSLSAIIAAISSEDGMGKIRAYPRLEEKRELWILGVAVVLLTVLCGLADFSRNVAALVLVGMCAAAQWIGFGTAGGWLPALPVLAAILAMVVVAGLPRRKIPSPTPVLVAAPVPEIHTPPAPAVEAAPPKPELAKKDAKPPAKKAASKKAARRRK